MTREKTIAVMELAYERRNDVFARDAAAMLRADGETITALEAERDRLARKLAELREENTREKFMRDQSENAVADMLQTVSLINEQVTPIQAERDRLAGLLNEARDYVTEKIYVAEVGLRGFPIEIEHATRDDRELLTRIDAALAAEWEAKDGNSSR